jgi:O-antigen ligase
MTGRTAVKVKRTLWQGAFAAFAFVQVAGTFTDLTDRLYVVKWLSGVAIGVSFLLLGHCRLSRALSREFALLVAVILIGLGSQLGAGLDGRALALGTSYALTATAAFLVGPCTFRRRSVQKLVWPALLLGMTAATLLSELLGLSDPLRSVLVVQDRWRYSGAFFQPNVAGMAGLVGVLLAAAAATATRRWTYLLAALPHTVVMVLAASRGSLLAAAVFAATAALVQTTRLKARSLATVACAGALVVLIAVLGRSSHLDLPDASHTRAALNQLSTGRLTNWSDALGYLGGPLDWGVGLGLSRNLSFAARETDFPVPVRGSNADNFYVDLLGRAGIVGSALFFAVVASMGLRLARDLRYLSPRCLSERALALAILAATLTLGITNSVILTWAWLHAMIAWPLIAATATRPSASLLPSRPFAANA